MAAPTQHMYPNYGYGAYPQYGIPQYGYNPHEYAIVQQGQPQPPPQQHYPVCNLGYLHPHYHYQQLSAAGPGPTGMVPNCQVTSVQAVQAAPSVQAVQAAPSVQAAQAAPSVQAAQAAPSVQAAQAAPSVQAAVQLPKPVPELIPEPILTRMPVCNDSHQRATTVFTSDPEDSETATKITKNVDVTWPIGAAVVDASWPPQHNVNVPANNPWPMLEPTITKPLQPLSWTSGKETTPVIKNQVSSQPFCRGFISDHGCNRNPCAFSHDIDDYMTTYKLKRCPNRGCVRLCKITSDHCKVCNQIKFCREYFGASDHICTNDECEYSHDVESYMRIKNLKYCPLCNKEFCLKTSDKCFQCRGSGANQNYRFPKFCFAHFGSNSECTNENCGFSHDSATYVEYLNTTRLHDGEKPYKQCIQCESICRGTYCKPCNDAYYAKQEENQANEEYDAAQPLSKCKMAKCDQQTKFTYCKDCAQAIKDYTFVR